MKIASLDLGSNTTLMLIAEVSVNGIEKIYGDYATVTRLGQDLEKTGNFSKEALLRMDACLAEYRKIMNEHQVEKVVGVATSAARDAWNKSELMDIVDKYKIPLSIISGDEEANITFLGSCFDIDEREGVAVIDTGGGSTEIIAQIEGMVGGISLDIGSVRLTERFITGHPISKDELKTMKECILDEIQKNRRQLPKVSGVKKVVAVAGTPTTLAMVALGTEFSEKKIHGYSLSLEKLGEWMNKLASITVVERQALVGMHPKRADVIVAGAMILHALAEYLGATEIKVSTKGVRYGLALRHSSL